MYPIIIITPPDNGQIDGVGTFCTYLAEGLARYNLFTVAVVTPSASVPCLTSIPFMHSKDLLYYRCPIPNGSSGIGQYIKELFCGHPALILLNYWPSIFNIRSIRTHLPETKIIQIIHDLPWLSVFKGDPEMFFKSYATNFQDYTENERKFLKYSTYDTLISFKETDCIICLCNDSLKIINQNYQIPLNKIHLIPNGVPDKVHEQTTKRRFPNQASPQMKVLFVGRPTLSKGWDRVISLAAHFKRERIDAVILCVGVIQLNSIIPKELIPYFCEIGILPNQELNKLYSQVDFVFIPTRHEQCSYVAIEAMMHGAEIVAFDSFGLRDMLDDECAYIIESVPQFPLFTSRKGKHARKRYVDRFTSDSMIRKYIHLFSQITFS